MTIKTIDAALFQAMVQAGQYRLNQNEQHVNKLNVFPVPDGDTGTNMNLTMTSGATAISNMTDEHVGTLNAAFAKGLLMGARGNSGVILSQLFRGFSKQIQEEETLNSQTLASAFMHGVEVAYKAVMKPVEGTILTVAREAAHAAVEAAKNTDDCLEVMEAVVAEGQKALDNTTNQLPVLKEVGVVDSGGQGLMFIYEGFLAGLKGEELPEAHTATAQEFTGMINTQHDEESAQLGFDTEDIQFGYCTEIMVRLGEGPTVTDTFDYDEFRNFLNEIGDSLLVVADDEVVKVHVHTEEPGTVLAHGLKYGSLIKVKVDNMRLQHETILENEEHNKEEAVSHQPKEKMGVITIAAGEGIQELFKSLGVMNVINGGQTMNPSTEDILKAIENTNAEEIVILPNNKNIFMAAEQAAEVSDLPVAVVPSRTVSQGMTAMLQFNPQASLEENAKAMTDALTDVVSGQVTTAVRDTTIEGLEIHKDDYIGMIDNKIVVSVPNRYEAVVETFKQMLDEDSEIITIIIGEEGNKTEAEAIAEALEEMDDELEIEIHQGDQPVYPYIFSVE